MREPQGEGFADKGQGKNNKKKLEVSCDHRSTEQVGLEGTSGAHIVQLHSEWNKRQSPVKWLRSVPS